MNSAHPLRRRVVPAVLAALLVFVGVGAAPAGGLDQAKAGLDALEAGDGPKAVALLTEAIASGELPEEQSHVFLTARGYAKAVDGDFQNAIEDYSLALARKPDYLPAAYNRGNAHYHLQQYDRAIEDYTRVLEADIADVRSLNNRGAAWFKKGNLQSAMANYTTAIAANPEDPDLFLNRGKVYEALGDPDKAREDFLQVKKLDPAAKTPLD